MTGPVCCMQFGGVDLDPDSSTFWFAGKQLQPDKKLSDYLGRNENTRAVVKLQKKGAGPPAREPVSHTHDMQQLQLWACALLAWSFIMCEDGICCCHIILTMHICCG